MLTQGHHTDPSLPSVDELQLEAMRVVDWLETLPRTYAAPVVVKIGRQRYAGAFYTQVRDSSPGTHAYQSGERSYGHSMLYLVGRLPYVYRRSRFTAFRTNGGRFPFLVGSWYQESTPTPHSPFGACFQLFHDKHDIARRYDGSPYRVVSIDLIG